MLNFLHPKIRDGKYAQMYKWHSKGNISFFEIQTNDSGRKKGKKCVTKV